MRFDVDRSQWLPTMSDPGSEEKISVLTSRVAAGFPLWHPGDYHRLGTWAASEFPGVFDDDADSNFCDDDDL